jgi:hypothetical protein
MVMAWAAEWRCAMGLGWAMMGEIVKESKSGGFYGSDAAAIL